MTPKTLVSKMPKRSLLVVVTLLAVAASNCGSSADSDMTNTAMGLPGIPVIGLDDDPAASTAFAVVAAAYEAHGAADIGAWNTARKPGSESASDQVADLFYQTQVAMFAAGDTFDVAHCTCHGYGDWPDIAESGDLATGYRLQPYSWTPWYRMGLDGTGHPRFRSR